MISMQELGDYTIADEDFFDFQTITEAMMTTTQSMVELLIRFFLNLIICWIIVQFFYYKKSRRRDYYFTFMIFSSAMLMLLYIMGNVEIGVGLTLGLFAIFGVIRYRTETVPIREMTYLFVIIALAAVNGLAPLYKLVGTVTDNIHYELSWGTTLITVISNLLIVLLISVLESDRILKHTSMKLVLYDRIELIVPERREELIADLEERIGLKVDNVEIGHVDFLKDSAFVKIYYTLEKGQTAAIDTITKANQFIEQ
jgi:magnesium-transporting ATPase (P-type)